MTIKKLGFLICAVAFATAGCGKTTATTAPTSLLRIDSVTPTALQPSPASQTLTVMGAGFSANLDLVVTGPNTPAETDVVRFISSTEVRADVVLSSAGTYTLRIDDLTAKTSVSTTIVVGPGQSQAPTLSSVSPGLVTRSAQPQSISVLGRNLATAQQLQVSRPDGQTVTLVPGQFTVVDDTTLTLSAVFDRAGVYSVAVTTAAGVSNTVTITAN
jgi:hypothetical protein